MHLLIKLTLNKRMKKIIGMMFAFLLPVVSFAQNYSQRMMDFNRGYGNDFSYSSSLWFLPFIFIFPVIGVAIAIAVFIFWIMMLIDAIKHSPEKLKIVWVIVIIFTHVIGALIYYFVEKRPRDKSKMHSHQKIVEDDQI